MTSHYQILTSLENTLTQQNLGGCCNLYWAVLSTVNRNKVHIPFCVCLSVCACVPLFNLISENNVLWYHIASTSDSKTRIYPIIPSVSLFSRIHPDHNDDGGVSAACCHDCHPGGELSCYWDLYQIHCRCSLINIENTVGSVRNRVICGIGTAHPAWTKM